MKFAIRSFLVLVVASVALAGCGSNGDGYNCVAAQAVGNCATVQTCCTLTSCYYKADGQKFSCSGLDCASAATDLTKHCAGSADVIQDTVQPTDNVQQTDNPAAKATFKGILKDFQTNAPVADATITILDNTTGAATTKTVTSGADGAVSIEMDAGSVFGLKNSKAGSKDTYQFNLKAEEQDRTLYLVSETTFALAPALAGLTPDAAKGVIAGGVFYGATREAVGCATVETDPAGEYRYFPKPAEGAPTLPSPDATQTSKANGFFLGANVPVGKVTIKAKIGTTEIGSTTFFSFADSISISDVIATGAANPTPAECAL